METRNIAGNEPNFQEMRLVVHTKILIDGIPFQAAFLHKENENLITASWTDSSHPLGITSLAALAGMDISDFSDWDIKLTEARFSYLTTQKSFNFSLVSSNYGTLSILSGHEALEIALKLNKKLEFYTLPVIGSYFKQEDKLELCGLQYTKGEDKGDFSASFLLTLFGRQVYPLANDMEQATTVKWFKLNKSLGPVHLHRLGFALAGKEVKLYLDISFLIGPVRIGLDGLNAGIPISLDWSEFEVALAGLSVDFSSGGLTLGGELYHSVSDPYRYDGRLNLAFASFKLTAFASYTIIKDSTSLFAYAFCGFSLGGPPAFRLTGIAVGFGVNRQILLPPLDGISTYPLVTAADTGRGPTKVDDALIMLQDSILPSKDDYFAVAGAAFDSFGIARCMALIVVCFGTRFELHVLGKCTVELPPKQTNPIARVILPFKIDFCPDEGYFLAAAKLASGSYILDPNCHLTGGFALEVWFGGAHKGDFVITLGGYHQSFQPPKHYPTVDRLGVNWQINKNLSLRGSAYFAVTPGCAMAGGDLELTFQAGALKAWFYARADFMIQWKPLYFNADIEVRLGVSYRVDFLFIHHTFSLELCAGLNLFGPPMGGKLHIKWAIISFTISFGESKPKPPNLNWSTFRKDFLPEKPLTIHPQRGIKPVNEVLYATGGSFSFEIQSSIPATTIVNNPHKQNGQNSFEMRFDAIGLGIRPMGESHLQAPLIVEFEWVHDNIREPISPNDYKVLYNNLPSALWGADDKENRELMQDIPTGLLLEFSPKPPSHSTSAYLAENFLAENPLIGSLPSFVVTKPIQQHIYNQNQWIQYLQDCADSAVSNARNKELDTLRELGFQLPKPNLDMFARSPEQYVRAPIQLRTIGQ